MGIINQNGELTIDLFHGTSTLFLDSIIENGLGGHNPIAEWRVLELAKEVYDLSEKHITETAVFQNKSNSFKQMTEQKNDGGFNWQHGQTYLSPIVRAAARYAIHPKYGSELLTYTIDFLKELLKLDIRYVTQVLSREYKTIFELINVNPAPILVQAKKINKSLLLDEYGNSPDFNLEEIEEEYSEDPELKGVNLLEQCNFRLTGSVPKENLTIYLVNVKAGNTIFPGFKLHEIKME